MSNALTARRVRRKIRRQNRTLGQFDFGSAFGGLASAGLGIWQGIEQKDLQETQIKAQRDIAIAKANAEAAAAAAQAERNHALALRGQVPEKGGIPTWAYALGAVVILGGGAYAFTRKRKR